jgi:chemotaxis protein CheD
VTLSIALGPPEVAAPKGIYLHPGHLWVSSERCAITTILGSCVAVGLWDREAQIGGLNHFLLPHRAGRGSLSPRFGNVAMEQLLEKLASSGSPRERLHAKLFGGACVLEAMRSSDHLGRKNVELARRVLEDARIPLVAEDTLGNLGRKLVFHTHDGSAWVKLLSGESAWK